MAQILLSSTCKASVGERERERQTNEKSGARASGGAGASCECRAGGNVLWGAKDLLSSIFGAINRYVFYFLAGGPYVFVSHE